MAKKSENLSEFEKELKKLIERQTEEFRKKTNPLYFKMHSMDDEEAEEFRQELRVLHENECRQLAQKYGVKYDPEKFKTS